MWPSAWWFGRQSFGYSCATHSGGRRSVSWRNKIPNRDISISVGCVHTYIKNTGIHLPRCEDLPPRCCPFFCYRTFHAWRRMPSRGMRRLPVWKARLHLSRYMKHLREWAIAYGGFDRGHFREWFVSGMRFLLLLSYISSCWCSQGRAFHSEYLYAYTTTEKDISCPNYSD